MRLILIGRALSRQLCRVGLHRWRPVREIASMEPREVSPDGMTFLPIGSYFTDRCVRPGCGRERW